MMKGDKLGTVSRIPAGRPGQPGSRGAAESPRIKGIWRERGSGRPAPAGLPPRRPRRPGVGGCGPRVGTPGFPACLSRGLRRRRRRLWAARPGRELRRARGSQVSARAPRAGPGAQDNARGPSRWLGSGGRAGPGPGSGVSRLRRPGPQRPSPWPGPRPAPSEATSGGPRGPRGRVGKRKSPLRAEMRLARGYSLGRGRLN